MEGKWLSIIDYARYKGISISTIRRYIKAGRVKYRLQAGKYEIFVSQFYLEKISDGQDKELFKLKLENEELRRQNQLMVDELSELKMLISVYEKGSRPTAENNPEAPPAFDRMI